MKIFKEFCFLIGLVHQIMRLNEEPLRSVALVPEEIWSVAFLFEKQKQDETRFWTIIVTWQTMKSHDKYFRWEKQLSTVTMMMTTTMMSTTSTQVRFSLYPRFRVGDSSRRRQKEAFSLEKKPIVDNVVVVVVAASEKRPLNTEKVSSGPFPIISGRQKILEQKTNQAVDK